MTTFIDTSALYAILDRDDANNGKAVQTFRDLTRGEPLITHNYVAVETITLVHNRLGAGAARETIDDLLPSIGMIWVGEDVHRAAASAFLAALRRKVSLVDWVSFEVMRRAGVRRAFAFDRDFTLQGLETLP